MSRLIKRKPEVGMYRRKGMSAYRKGKSMGTHTMAKIAYNGYKILRTMVNAEKHYIDTSTSTQPGTTPAVIGIVSSTQGDDTANRSGDSIKVTRVTVKGEMHINSGSAFDYVKIALVCDKNNQGSAPAWTDVFDSGDTLCRTNVDNMDRFVIMKTWHLPFNLSTAYNHVISFSKKLDFHVKYGGNAGTTADYRNNALYLMYVCGDNTNKAGVSLQSRVVFYDN